MRTARRWRAAVFGALLTCLSTAPAMAASFNSTTYLTTSSPTVLLGQSVTFRAVVSPSLASGTVTFMDGPAQFATCTLAAGACSVSTSGLTGGTHTIYASYGGDSSYQPSTASITQVISTGATQVALVGNPNPVASGSPVTFVASVAPAAATGSVAFYDGSTLLGSDTTETNGQWTLTTSSLSLGAHTITATFTSSNGYNNSTSAPLAFTVIDRTTTTVVTSNMNPSGSGQPVTFTAAVTPSTANGYVDFFDGTTRIARDTARDAYGRWAVTTNTLGVGTHNVTAVFVSSNGYSMSVSPAITQTVDQYLVTASLVAGNVSPFFGETVTFSASVFPTNSIGSVTLYDGSRALSSCKITMARCAIPYSGLSVGTHSLTAQFTGDVGGGAVSKPITVTVRPTTAYLLVTASASSVRVGQSVRLTARLSRLNVDGKVLWSDGSSSLGSCTLVNGSCMISAAFSAGIHRVSARYSGNEGIIAASSIPISVFVNRTSSSLALKASPANIRVGQKVTLAARITPPGARGRITFTEGARTIGSCKLASGVCRISLALTTPGMHLITARYEGDRTHVVATSSYGVVVVVPARTVTVTGSDTKVIHISMGSPFARKLVSVMYQNPGKDFRLLMRVTLNAAGEATVTTRTLQPGAVIRIMSGGPVLKQVTVS